MPRGKSKAKVSAKRPRARRRGYTGMTRNYRGVPYATDINMMTRSVLNTVQNLPTYLQKHVDDRMDRMHKELLWKADEMKRSKPERMEVEKPQIIPEVEMADLQSASQSASQGDIIMQPPPPVRDPLTRTTANTSRDTSSQHGTLVFQKIDPKPMTTINKLRPMKQADYFGSSKGESNRENRVSVYDESFFGKRFSPYAQEARMAHNNRPASIKHPRAQHETLNVLVPYNFVPFNDAIDFRQETDRRRGHKEYAEAARRKVKGKTRS